MKNLVSKLMAGKLAVLAALICMNCADDNDITPTTKTSSRTTIGTSGFSLWTTCGSNAYVSGSNIVVPIGTGCGSKVDAAQAKSSIYGSNWYANASISGGSGASSSASEMAIFTADNVSSWNGDEMGFVRTLNDNSLKAYAQGGGQYIYTGVGAGSNYKCSAYSAHTVTYYVNGGQVATLTNNSGNYQNRNYYFVATNHYYGGGNPANWNITFNSANVW